MTKTITLNDEGVGIIIESLSMRRNFIETGNATLSAKDVQKLDDDDARRLRVGVRALDTDQMRLIIKIDDLCTELLKR